MQYIRKASAFVLALAALTLMSSPVFANPAQISVAQAKQQKPFAAAHVVLQISDGSPKKQTLVLNVAHNLLKYYGPDKVDIEIVAFGPGLRLLFKGNAEEPRIASMAADGVRFSACANTIKHMSKILGYKPVLTKYARVVPAGIVRLVELDQAGYFVSRP